MFAVFYTARKFWNRRFTPALAAMGVMALAACEPMAVGGMGGPQVSPGDPVPVALLVPRGSGNSGDTILAQSLENAARLAASELSGAQIDLRVYDTAANAQIAAQQATRAVDEGARIIIGPVYGEAANAAGVAVAGRGVNVLAFSNNTAIAGGNVFVLGPTFDNTARRLMGYAASQGRNRVVVVHGDDVAGQSGLAAVQRAAAGTGIQIVGTVGHAQSQAGVAGSVSRITSAVNSGDANAIFLTATSAAALPLFSSLLPEAGITNSSTQYIGLSRWDIPAQTMSLPGLQGGWFALPDPGRTAAFSSRYQAAYGAQPHPIGGLAFDAVAAIGALVAQGNRDALTRRALTQTSGFQGASGIFRLRPDGTNERALAVAAVRNGQPAILDPGPQSFAGF